MLVSVVKGIVSAAKGWGFMDGFEEAALPELCICLGIGGVGLVGGLSAMVVSGIVEDQNKIQIERNIAETTGFAKFTGNAFTVTRDNDKFYTEIFGVAIQNVGSSPEFCSVTYEVDKDFYDKAFKYVDINYNYGTSGQLIGAENVIRTPDVVLAVTRAIAAERDLFARLVKITETEVVNTRFYSSSEKITASVTSEESIDGFLTVTGIGGLNFNNDESLVSFTIDLVDAQKDKSVVAKRLLITQAVTPEILADPNKAYQNYANDPSSCDIDELGKSDGKVKMKFNLDGRVVTLIDGSVEKDDGLSL